MNLLTEEREAFKWWPTIEVAKFNPDITREVTEHLGYEPVLADFERLGVAPDEITHAEGNALTTVGLNRLASLFGGSGQAFSSPNSVVGVGNGTTGFLPGQTDLTGASKWFQATDGGAGGGVSVTNAIITAIATFGAANANFAWEEWCWVATNAAKTSQATIPAGVMMNRKVQSLGTKASGASWTLTTTVTLS
jgi:hypothetical protein